eukprot:765874-Hanusia_phi.AAC.1
MFQDKGLGNCFVRVIGNQYMGVQGGGRREDGAGAGAGAGERCLQDDERNFHHQVNNDSIRVERINPFICT